MYKTPLLTFQGVNSEESAHMVPILSGQFFFLQLSGLVGLGNWVYRGVKITRKPWEGGTTEHAMEHPEKKCCQMTAASAGCHSNTQNLSYM